MYKCVPMGLLYVFHHASARSMQNPCIQPSKTCKDTCRLNMGLALGRDLLCSDHKIRKTVEGVRHASSTCGSFGDFHAEF